MELEVCERPCQFKSINILLAQLAFTIKSRKPLSSIVMKSLDDLESLEEVSLPEIIFHQVTTTILSSQTLSYLNILSTTPHTSHFTRLTLLVWLSCPVIGNLEYICSFSVQILILKVFLQILLKLSSFGLSCSGGRKVPAFLTRNINQTQSLQVNGGMNMIIFKLGKLPFYHYFITFY